MGRKAGSAPRQSEPAATVLSALRHEAACPKHRRINLRARPFGLLRTYSARIYFIVSNSSLACLHMPHPSNPVDDIRVRPSYRELWPAHLRGAAGLEDVWLARFAVWFQSRRKLASGLDVSLMDYFLYVHFVLLLINAISLMSSKCFVWDEWSSLSCCCRQCVAYASLMHV